MTMSAAAQTNTSLKVDTLPPKDKVDLYLLIGQSNMAGRGVPEAEDKQSHPRVFFFTTNQTWQLAAEPITFDPKKFHGVGPGVAFGKAMAEANQTRFIGLVPCAVGGTPLRRWLPGADLYSNAVRRTKLAMNHGTLKGILWHQGESDSNEKDSATYGARLASMIQSLRKEFSSPNVPFVAGELGQFLITRTNHPNLFAKRINETLQALPTHVEKTGCVESTGLNHKGDDLHFDSASQREFGRRYARKMMELQ
jgi:hypothetical protein